MGRDPSHKHLCLKAKSTLPFKARLKQLNIRCDTRDQGHHSGLLAIGSKDKMDDPTRPEGELAGEDVISVGNLYNNSLYSLAIRSP